MIPAWLSFLIVLTLILFFSKKELGIVLIFGSILLGVLTNVDLFKSSLNVFCELSTILIALSVFLIALLGGIMEESGLILELINKLRVSNKISLMLSPAIFGLLPVAGGALMSAPIVDQIDPTLSSHKKVSINVWYRHVLLLIYPLSSAILVASSLSGLALYNIIIALIIPFFGMFAIGYITLLRPITSRNTNSERNLKVVLYNIFPIIIAPIIDFLGRLFFPFIVPEFFLLIGLFTSISIALQISHTTPSSIFKIMKKMKIWRFPLLIIAMFLFLDVFISSSIPEDLGGLNLSFELFILIGFFLGFATGRVQLPISILIPIYLTQNSLFIMPLFNFTFMYVAIFLGYLITPLHPCLAYNINYFKTDFKKTIKTLSAPTFICLGILFAAYFIMKLIIMIT
ncbi:MAG: DUF401 family protein [Candidatus Lokiarchaeota archaeon]|nr:DUF401 family protein [Candidatus Lokiarchaeota archaeon]